MRHSLRTLPCLLVLAAGCGNPSSLPPISEIEDMRAGVYDPETGKKVEFAVPTEHWPAVTEALLPATRDRNPAKWVSVGELEIGIRGGGRRTVWLFSTSEGPGAFAVGEDWDRRVYYRGGESAKLLAALATARKASRDR